MAEGYFNAYYSADELLQLNIPQFGQCREWLDLKGLTHYASVSERTMRQ
jgi:hypothetical protein